MELFVASGSEADFSRFAAHLEEWDEIAQPLQLAQEAKGADDAHSLELYEKIREKAIALANDEERHHEALQITKLSTKVFAELPWAAEKLREDAQSDGKSNKEQGKENDNGKEKKERVRETLEHEIGKGSRTH